MAIRVMRGSLFMAINNPRFANSAWRRNSDGVTLDMEDAVGEKDKPYGRTLYREAIAKVSRSGAAVSTRINHMYWEADLEACVWPGQSCLSQINYPKCESREELQRVDAKLSEMERRRGVRSGTIGLSGAIETVRGVVHAYEIATTTSRTKSFGGGNVQIDQARDLAIETMPEMRRTVDFYGTGECGLVALALGLKTGGASAGGGGRSGANAAADVISGDTAFEEAATNRRMGVYGGGLCLHPNRVEGLNKGYVPPPEEVEEARKLIGDFEELDARGEVKGELPSGRVVDKWEVEKAKKLIEWAEACERKDREKVAALARAEAQG